MSGLEIEGLRVSIGNRDVVSAVDLHVEPGTCAGLVGESGSGKSLTALASLGLLPRVARVTAGRILVAGDETVTADRDHSAQVRGSGIAMIFQSPRAALNPVLRAGRQVERVLRHKDRHDDRTLRSVELLGAVGLREPDKVSRLYPHELSGGMCQRVMIAMAIASQPQILIADEPTTALDVTVQADILDLLDDLRSRTGMGVLLISHDVSVVAERCQSIAVMRQGAIVEAGSSRSVINSPSHPFTAELVRDLTHSPETTARSARASSAERAADPTAGRRVRPLIEVRGLRKDYQRGGDVLHAVDGIDLALMPGECVGVIGESGAGKSTLARCMTRLERPTSGRVFFRDTDVTGLSDRALHWFRREVQPVFQEPLTALNPRWTVRRLIAEPLKIHGERDVQRRVDEVLRDVGLSDELMTRRPLDLSGGERQRVAIARAVVLRPSVLVLDEPTASVDMSSKRALLALLKHLQSEHGLTCLYISHDLRTIEETCSRTIVMYRGRLAEEGPTAAVLNSPSHVYTQILVSAIPRVGSSTLRGSRPRALPLLRPHSPPGSGCIFLDRCPRAVSECAAIPPVVEVTPGHRAACLLADRKGGSQ